MRQAFSEKKRILALYANETKCVRVVSPQQWKHPEQTTFLTYNVPTRITMERVNEINLRTCFPFFYFRDFLSIRGSWNCATSYDALAHRVTPHRAPIIGFPSCKCSCSSISINQHSARLCQRRRFILVTYAYTASIAKYISTSRVVKIRRIYFRMRKIDSRARDSAA